MKKFDYRVIKSTDVATVVGALRQGLPYARLIEFMKRSGLSSTEISQVIHVPKRTLARRKEQGRLKDVESERLLRLSIVFEKAVGLFNGDAEGARRWLSRPAKALGDLTPLEMTETEIGASEVENLIGRLEHGVIT